MNELQRLRKDFEKIRTRLVKLETAKDEMFRTNNRGVKFDEGGIYVEDTLINKRIYFYKEHSLPMLIRAVEEAKRRFNL